MKQSSNKLIKTSNLENQSNDIIKLMQQLKNDKQKIIKLSKVFKLQIIRFITIENDKILFYKVKNLNCQCNYILKKECYLYDIKYELNNIEYKNTTYQSFKISTSTNQVFWIIHEDNNKLFQCYQQLFSRIDRIKQIINEEIIDIPKQAQKIVKNKQQIIKQQKNEKNLYSVHITESKDLSFHLLQKEQFKKSINNIQQNNKVQLDDVIVDNHRDQLSQDSLMSQNLNDSNESCNQLQLRISFTHSRQLKFMKDLDGRFTQTEIPQNFDMNYYLKLQKDYNLAQDFHLTEYFIDKTKEFSFHQIIHNFIEIEQVFLNCIFVRTSIILNKTQEYFLNFISILSKQSTKVTNILIAQQIQIAELFLKVSAIQFIQKNYVKVFIYLQKSYYYYKINDALFINGDFDENDKQLQILKQIQLFGQGFFNLMMPKIPLQFRQQLLILGHNFNAHSGYKILKICMQQIGLRNFYCGLFLILYEIEINKDNNKAAILLRYQLENKKRNQPIFYFLSARLASKNYNYANASFLYKYTLSRFDQKQRTQLNLINLCLAKTLFFQLSFEKSCGLFTNIFQNSFCFDQSDIKIFSKWACKIGISHQCLELSVLTLNCFQQNSEQIL